MDKNALTLELNQIIGYYLAKKHTSTSYAVMIDGKLVANDSLGTTGGKDPKPATVDNTYNVASISKMFTTTCVMQLVEAGKLDLDVPVITYIPEFKMLSEGYKRVTLRQCLSHSCGLPGTQWLNFSVSDMSEVDYYKDALNFYANSHLKAEPGEYSVYCNDGFTLAEMCVAAVSEEKSFSEYCRIHVTDPLKAWSSRFAQSYNKDYTIIAEGKGPTELVTSQGLGGLTTSMKHLVLFGNEFLKTKSKMLSRKSMDEMAKKQGVTFLKKDEATSFYGLGWDNVNYQHPDYDLGEGSVRKGGASFQFGSQLLVVPKYKAVVAVSQTYDCCLDTRDLALKLLAVSMLREKGVNITRFKDVPESFEKKYGGDYLTPYTPMVVHFHGPLLFVTAEDSRGNKRMINESMGYTGRCFEDLRNRKLVFESVGAERYMLLNELERFEPMAQKARDGKALSKTWLDRIGKKYVNVSITPYDEVASCMMAGFVLKRFKDTKGIMIVCFQNVDEGNDGVMDCPVKPLSANIATGFLNTPDNPSRDLISPIFTYKNGVEYCDAGSYRFRDCASLPVYQGQGFEPRTDETKAYSFGYKLSELPEIPAGRRIMVLNEDLDCVYDSLMMSDPYKPVEKGYLLLC